MPAFLKLDGETLTVKLGGMRGPEFGDALQRVKAVPGARYDPSDPENKVWRFPADADTALRLIQMLAPVASAEVQGMVRNRSAEVAASLVTKLPEDADLHTDIHHVEGFALRPYQRAAIGWLCQHPRTILADDMGLGKTAQALGFLAEATARGIVDDGRALIVCPNSVRGTWADEIIGWGAGDPEDVAVIDGKNPAARRAQLDAAGRFTIINWEKLRLMPELAKVEWVAVFADEAHRAKNRKAQQTKALWKLRAPLQLALSGTPVMNSPDELWALLKWLRPEQYTAFWPFHYSYVDEYPAHYGKPIIVGVKNADQLRFELADKLIRRTKMEVLTDLPPKTIQIVHVELNPKQRTLYTAAEKELLLDVQTVLAGEDEDAKAALRAALAAGDLERITYLIPNGAARMTRLRQIASTPALLGGPDDSGLLDAAVEIVRDNPGEPFVLFTWFADTARILADRLRRGKPTLRVGTIAGSDDADPVKDAFQAGDLDCVVATIAKGGQGLTLTRASECIAAEEDWVPAINSQAYDRLHRLGQKRPVTIHVLRARNTVHTRNIAPANVLKAMIAAQVHGE